jgi:hypothetical protein
MVSLQEEGFFSNPIEDNEDLIEEQELEEVIHEESHQAHEVEQELPHESIDEEDDLNEAHQVENPIQEEDPIKDTFLHEVETLVCSSPSYEDEVIQASFPPDIIMHWCLFPSSIASSSLDIVMHSAQTCST